MRPTPCLRAFSILPAGTLLLLASTASGGPDQTMQGGGDGTPADAPSPSGPLVTETQEAQQALATLNPFVVAATPEGGLVALLRIARGYNGSLQPGALRMVGQLAREVLANKPKNLPHGRENATGTAPWVALLDTLYGHAAAQQEWELAGHFARLAIDNVSDQRHPEDAGMWAFRLALAETAGDPAKLPTELGRYLGLRVADLVAFRLARQHLAGQEDGGLALAAQLEDLYGRRLSERLGAILRVQILQAVAEADRPPRAHTGRNATLRAGAFEAAYKERSTTGIRHTRGLLFGVCGTDGRAGEPPSVALIIDQELERQWAQAQSGSSPTAETFADQPNRDQSHGSTNAELWRLYREVLAPVVERRVSLVLAKTLLELRDRAADKTTEAGNGFQTAVDRVATLQGRLVRNDLLPAFVETLIERTGGFVPGSDAVLPGSDAYAERKISWADELATKIGPLDGDERHTVELLVRRAIASRLIAEDSFQREVVRMALKRATRSSGFSRAELMASVDEVSPIAQTSQLLTPEQRTELAADLHQLALETVEGLARAVLVPPGQHKARAALPTSKRAIEWLTLLQQSAKEGSMSQTRARNVRRELRLRSFLSGLGLGRWVDHRLQDLVEGIAPAVRGALSIPRRIGRLAGLGSHGQHPRTLAIRR